MRLSLRSLVSAIAALATIALFAACSSGMAGGDTAANRVTPGDAPRPADLATTVDSAWTLETPLRGEVQCTNGKVGPFDCHNVNLVSFLPLSAVGATQGQKGFGTTFYLNDIWGWTDAESGREFALLGRVNGTSFVEVTDPVNPKYLGDLPPPAGANPGIPRDIKVYKNHAFIVGDVVGPHGIQVFDLKQLLTVQSPPAVFQTTAKYDHVTNVHNLIIDTTSGFAYTTSRGKDCGGAGQGMQIVDIRDPAHPAFAGCSTMGGHDAQCVEYHGPDQRYRDHQICIHARGGSGLGIVDVTDKQQPKTLSTASYPNVRYAHQGWLSDDHRYFFLGDELDEGGNRMTRLIVFDLEHLDDPLLAKEFLGSTGATDHNLYVRGSHVFLANYKAGLRVLDVSDPISPKEVGYFDTAPAFDNVAGFAGAWSNYPYFKSGVVAVNSISEGLFLLRFTPPATPAP